MQHRRQFVKTLAILSAGAVLAPSLLESCGTGRAAADSGMFFNISLAEWSLNKAIRGGKMSNLDFPVVAKRDFGIEAIEYVNQLFMDKAKDTKYLKELDMRCKDNGVKSLLIMCDREGDMGDTDAKGRMQTVENHKKWVEAAKFLGCHSIRVNAAGKGEKAEVAKAAVESLGKLSEFAKPFGINVIVENHGGYSGYDGWLAGVMKSVNMSNCGILPDFGNFCMRYEGAAWETPCMEWSDRYEVTRQFMPYAKAVSAKAHDFDAQGNCVETDYMRMMKIVKDGGYRGYVGIEYEGSKLDEYAGIRATKALLEKVGKAL
jgi:sugar phosphate isomerase/epimerase